MALICLTSPVSFKEGNVETDTPGKVRLDFTRRKHSLWRHTLCNTWFLDLQLLNPAMIYFLSMGPQSVILAMTVLLG